MSLPGFLVLGHVTRDLLPFGQTRAGGTALYAAVCAQRLGMPAGIVSVGERSVLHGLSDPLQLAWRDAPACSTFENIYTLAGRRQWLHALAPALRLSDVPRDWRAAPLVQFAPVLHEIPLALLRAFPQALIGLTPQGWLRRWQQQLPAEIQLRRWRPEAAQLAGVRVLVCSIEDLAGDEALARYYAQICPIVALTRGARGATLYLEGVPQHVPAYPATELDPTGAGDVFAAALLIALYEGRPALEAAHFAAAAAACAVEGPGLSTLHDRKQVEQRMQVGQIR